jgi:hypothetical protein
MDRAEIIDALTALAAELESRGVSGEMYVVGGAAIALAFDERRATRDIDAVFEPKSKIYEAAANLPGLRCLTASPKILLALKVLAHRVGEDEDDLRMLAKALGLGSADQVLAVAEGVYGDRLDPAARFFVEEVFGGD